MPGILAPREQPLTRRPSGRARSGSSSASARARSGARQPRVRHGQAGLVDDAVAVDEQVEVDRARAEPRPCSGRGRARARLRGAGRGVARLELGLDRGGTVQEAGRSVYPTGSVSRKVDTCNDLDFTPASRSSTARRRVASRSPRFAPSPT